MEKNKTDDILFESRLHWIIFTLPVALMFGSLLLYLFFHTLFEVCLMLFGVGVVVLMVYWVSYQFSRFQVLAGGVRIKEGIIVRQSTNVPYKSIETIDIRQNILGSLLDYGTLVIRGSGGTYNIMNHIRHPLTCRRHIEAQLP